MHKYFLIRICAAFLFCLAPAGATETIEQMQSKLAKAMHEIESLKAKLAQSQRVIEKVGAAPVVAPSADILMAHHPIVSADDLAMLAADRGVDLKKTLGNKVISVTGSIDRFSEGFGRNFRVFLQTGNTNKEVSCQFYCPAEIQSVHTAHEGSEMILERANKSPVLLAGVREEVIVSGFFESNNRRRVTITDCVLQKP